jgi:hypothetical protein
VCACAFVKSWLRVCEKFLQGFLSTPFKKDASSALPSSVPLVCGSSWRIGRVCGVDVEEEMGRWGDRRLSYPPHARQHARRLRRMFVNMLGIASSLVVSAACSSACMSIFVTCSSTCFDERLKKRTNEEVKEPTCRHQRDAVGPRTPSPLLVGGVLGRKPCCPPLSGSWEGFPTEPSPRLKVEVCILLFVVRHPHLPLVSRQRGGDKEVFVVYC